MRFFEDLDDSLLFFKALSSNVRIQILKLLNQEKEINLNELASRIGITNGAMTAHIKMLEEAGLINTRAVVAKHGMQKLCSLCVEKYVVHIGHIGHEYNQNSFSVEIPPGQYVDYEVNPTCGIATTERIIGVYDTPKYFSDTEHFQAQIVWFTTGFVEYEIPNYLPEKAVLKGILFQAELGSEAATYNNDYKSDIHFYINGQFVGIWQSPGDFGGVKGFYNPDWWPPSMNQYGTLMEFSINKEGTFIEGEKYSDTTIDQLNIRPGTRIRIRLAVPEGLHDSRGLTIFGRGFGNYNSGMIIRIEYETP
ncbi:MAG: helix-turn-helix domain-containing protein [Clostridiaceae bacterium]|nr:helix-turn-helix domain-containing protein [Clostridiaceae bacterium]